MNYIRIEGDINDINKLFTVDEVDIATKSPRNISNDRWELNAYCTASAIANIQALGLQVDILIDDAALDQHLASLEDNEDGTAIV